MLYGEELLSEEAEAFIDAFYNFGEAPEDEDPQE